MSKLSNTSHSSPRFCFDTERRFAVSAPRRPQGRSALAGTEQAPDRVGLSLARESERVAAPLDLSVGGRPKRRRRSLDLSKYWGVQHELGEQGDRAERFTDRAVDVYHPVLGEAARWRDARHALALGASIVTFGIDGFQTRLRRSRKTP